MALQGVKSPVRERILQEKRAPGSGIRGQDGRTAAPRTGEKLQVGEEENLAGGRM